jgi:hypothetical protein
MADHTGQLTELSFDIGGWYRLAEEHVNVGAARLAAAYDNWSLGFGASVNGILEVEVFILINVNRTKEACVVLSDWHNTDSLCSC